MQIKITDVRVSKVKTYQVAEIAYQDYRGEAKSWKLMSFSNPSVFAILKDAKAGESYEITTGKNDKDYTIWTQAVKLDGTTATATAPATPKAAWVPDADRQRLIVKQSSITAALKYLELNEVSPDDTKVVFNLADEFVKYVYDVPALEVEGQE